jgi:hypothetical protein
LRELEDRVMRNVFGSERYGVTGELRKLPHDLYFSPNIIRVVKSRTMRWAWHVARVG